ncbi:MAG TPA: hypothetical protein VK957_14790 [Lunatimonas sp.]|nr:hypothetical protein [Lunatimonas sp.]
MEKEVRRRETEVWRCLPDGLSAGGMADRRRAPADHGYNPKPEISNLKSSTLNPKS